MIPPAGRGVMDFSPIVLNVHMCWHLLALAWPLTRFQLLQISMRF